MHRLQPFTIRLVDRTQETSVLQPVRLKLDPGSKVTGMALVRETVPGVQGVIHLAELAHRGPRIRKLLDQRRDYRRRRRGTNLRYRASRFDNRRRRKGWLAPSLQHRVDTVQTWLTRYRRLAPITAITVERVRFDMQAIATPEIQGVEYQQGTLAGFEVREYLLEKFGRQCAYCDAKDVPLEVEHIVPKSVGGSNRVSNLTLSCHPCNDRKSTRRVEDFLASEPERLARLLTQAQGSLRDGAAVNATRWAIWEMLTQTELPVEATTGGRTKWNRTRLGIPKTDALDAAATGEVDRITGWQRPFLAIRCMGRGSHQRTRVTKHGFPRGYLTRTKTVHGFRTGDLVRANVPSGTHAGTYTGRVAIRARGDFNLQTQSGTIQSVSYRHCQLLQRGDGYGYLLDSATRSSAIA